MSKPSEESRKTWEDSFQEQIEKQAYNTAPVEAIVRTVSYYLRARVRPEDEASLHFMEMGCGAAPTLGWLAQRGIRVSGVDISPTALELARNKFASSGFADRIGSLVEGSVAKVPFENESFDGVIESCVFQHLSKDDRAKAFQEVGRVLKPGGVFVGHMLNIEHSTYQLRRNEELKSDPGTLDLHDGTSKIHLTNIGLTHFFTKKEFFQLLSGFSVIDPCLSNYFLPKEEAKRRGYDEYLQSMWIVYAVK